MVREKSKEIRDHYERVVMKGRKDQQRTMALKWLDYLLMMEDRSADDLKLAASRYAEELEEEAIPMGCATFYRHHWEDFLRDWEPPKAKAEWI